MKLVDRRMGGRFCASLEPVRAKVRAHLRVLRLLSRNELMVGSLWVHRPLRFKRVDGKSGWCDQSWEYLKGGLTGEA